MAYLAKIEHPGGAPYYSIRGEGGRLLKWLGRHATAEEILAACKRFGVKSRTIRRGTDGRPADQTDHR